MEQMNIDPAIDLPVREDPMKLDSAKARALT